MNNEHNNRWSNIVALYTEMTMPKINELKERLILERPEGGYKTKNDINPDTLAYIKSLKEFCDIFDIPIREHLKSVL
jgi:hypothetical protein